MSVLNLSDACLELDLCTIHALHKPWDAFLGREFVCHVPAHHAAIEILRAIEKSSMPSEVLQGTVTGVRASGGSLYLELSSRYYAGLRIAWIESKEEKRQLCLRYDAGNNCFNTVEVGFYLR